MAASYIMKYGHGSMLMNARDYVRRQGRQLEEQVVLSSFYDYVALSEWTVSPNKKKQCMLLVVSVNVQSHYIIIVLDNY